MTGTEIKEFVEEGLLDGSSINETLFYNLLNASKELVENDRDWAILRKTDTSKTASAGDSFLTEKACPTDFSVDLGMYLVDSSNNPEQCYPVSYEKRYFVKDLHNRYFVNLGSLTFGLTGSRSVSKTIHFVYKCFTSDITSVNSWERFPARFHKILGFLVADMFKGGVDYDEISVAQALKNRVDGMALWNAMISWDSRLKQREMGESYEGQGQYNSDGLPTGDQNNFPLGLM